MTIIININNNNDDIYGAAVMALIHRESSPGSFDEFDASWPPTLRSSQLTWAASPPPIITGS